MSVGRHAGTVGRGLIAFLALTVVAAWPSLARAVEQQGQVWVPITARITLTDRWKLYLEAQSRMDGAGMAEELLRSAIGFYVTPHWGLYLGYGWTPTFNPFADENRIYQESLLDNRFGALRLINRTRLEERFFEDVQGVSIRARHMLRLEHPLDLGDHWFVAASDELFFNLNSPTNGPAAGFDQNRVYIGLGYHVTRAVALELGYMNRFKNEPSPENLLNHIAVVSLDMSF